MGLEIIGPPLSEEQVMKHRKKRAIQANNMKLIDDWVYGNVSYQELYDAFVDPDGM